MPASAPSPHHADFDALLRLDEQVVVERVRLGDPVAFEAIFRLYHPELRTFAQELLGSRALAEEVVQDVFLVVWKGRGRWQVTTSLRAYLRRAVRNAAMRHRMAKRHAAAVRIDDVSRDATPRVAALPDPAPAPDALVEQAALVQAVDAAACAMSRKTREVFALRRAEVPNREIAERLGLSLKTVEMHVTRALAVLRQRLASWRD